MQKNLGTYLMFPVIIDAFYYGKPLKLVNQSMYLGSNISSTKSDINTLMGKA